MKNQDLFLTNLLTRIQKLALILSIIDFIAFILANGPYGAFSHLFFLYGALLNILTFLLLRNPSSSIVAIIKNSAIKSALLFSIVLVLITCSFTVILHAWPIELIIMIIFYLWLRQKLLRLAGLKG